MQPSARANRWTAGTRAILYLVALGVAVGALVLAVAIIFVMALGAFFGLGVLSIFVGMAGYVLWTHEPAADIPPR